MARGLLVVLELEMGDSDVVVDGGDLGESFPTLSVRIQRVTL